MVSEVRVWHYESPRLLWACPVVVDIEEDIENDDFIDRLVGVKTHGNCTISAMKNCT